MSMTTPVAVGIAAVIIARWTWGSQMKIPPTIEPIAHISPYRRIDPSHPGRKRVITLDEWEASGSTRKPDPAIYTYDARNRRWVLKEGVR
jgi:hypothetical protein